mmetsp:Transcript_87674/g.183296  ORF Transcript_87674/g.183296 Transcript_87674/m.183296 type:complete len:209 (+) Transcript_87674:151-777(+)
MTRLRCFPVQVQRHHSLDPWILELVYRRLCSTRPRTLHCSLDIQGGGGGRGNLFHHLNVVGFPQCAHSGDVLRLTFCFVLVGYKACCRLVVHSRQLEVPSFKLFKTPPPLGRLPAMSAAPALASRERKERHEGDLDQQLPCHQNQSCWQHRHCQRQRRCLPCQGGCWQTHFGLVLLRAECSPEHSLGKAEPAKATSHRNHKRRPKIDQ